MKQILKKLLFFLSGAAIALSVSAPALAAGKIELDRKGKLTLEYQFEKQPLADVPVSLYRVADVEASGYLKLSGDFKNYNVDLEDLDSTGWKIAAETFSVYISRDQIPPLIADKTEADGSIRFEELSTGLYLIKADDIRIGTNNYHSDPFFISLPSVNEDNEWIYDVKSHPKTITVTRANEKSITAVKVWNDYGSGVTRPENIQISLLKDGGVYDTVILSASNYWRYTWNGLDESHIWTVAENDVPAGYTAAYTKEGSIYTITNTAPGKVSGGGGGKGGQGGPKVPLINKETEKKIPLDNKDVDDPLEIIDIPNDPEPLSSLPQTGLLWWPVPFLALGGLTLFGMGYKRGKVLIRLGLLCLISAIGLTLSNLREEQQGEIFAGKAKEVLERQIIPEPDPGIDGYTSTATEIQTVDISGEEYIGVLSIPTLDLSLPVLFSWSNELLKQAPCRYKGSFLDDSMIIAGHNYKRHFSSLKKMIPGDEITLTDINGSIYRYKVKELEIIKGTDLEGMEEGEWDLTLFTCTYGGQDRVAVRCIRDRNERL